MRIALLTTSFPLSSESTSGAFVWRLVQHLPPDVSVTVLTPCAERTAATVRPSEQYSLRCFRYAPRRWQVMAHRPGGIPVAIHQNPWLLGLLPIFLLSMLATCLRHARRADLIHANWSINGAVAGLAGLIVRRPVVTTLRGSDIKRAKDSVIDRGLLKMCLLLSSKVVSVSFAIHNRVQSLCPWSKEKLLTIPNGVDDAFLRTAGKHRSAASDSLRIGTVGNLIPLKGTHLVVQALADMDPCGSSELVIIGEGPERHRLELMARELGLEQRVHLRGKIPPELIPRELEHLDTLVLASTSEGRPNVVLEAMAAGVAVVASDIAGVKELIDDGKTGLLFERGSVRHLSAQLARLRTNPQLRRRLGEAARRFIIASGLTWAHTAAQYATLYASIAPKPLLGK